MTGAVDISREACRDAADDRSRIDPDAAAMILALRAALDAAERERDGARRNFGKCLTAGTKLHVERDAADATGYARGVRDAADASWEILACPFDQIDCDLEMETPCPVCGDLGTWDDENLARVSNCKTPAAAILALLPATEKEKPDAE